MDFLRRILDPGEQPESRQQPQQQRRQPTQFRRPGGTQRGASPQQLTDQQAVERYRYMLQTAPPEAIEEAHAEAFARLTPEQRRMVLQELSQELPEHERSAGVAQRDDPRSLARMATRAEMRQPGTLERRFGGMSGPGMGVGLGGLMAGSFLSSIAGVVIGSAIADQFFGDAGSGDDDQGADGTDAGSEGDGGDYGDAGTDAGAGDYGSADSGGGFGDDFGGGDFGGDFGGEF